MAAASMYLGVLEAIFGFLVKIFSNIIMFVLEMIIGLLSGVLYSIGGTLLSIVDFIQSLFRKFAGIETIWYKGTETEGDILLYIISEKTVLQVFMALVLVSIAVLLMGTIIKIIQNEYSTEGAGNSKGTIVGSALKGLMMFIIVPIGVFGGLYASNFILRSIDKATNPSSSGKLGGGVFTASTTEANRFLALPETTWTILGGSTAVEPWKTWLDGAGEVKDGFKDQEFGKVMISKGLSLQGLTPTEAAQSAAVMIDDWFATGKKFEDLNNKTTNWQQFYYKYFTLQGTIGVDIDDLYTTSFDYTSTGQVGTFYRLRNVNFLILYAGGILAAYTMLMAIFGLINRIIKGAIYFMLAPIPIASYPFNNGSALKTWQGTFIKNALAAYGTVVALNLLFVILPILKNIQLFEPKTNKIYNSYVFLLLTLCCLLFFKSAPGLISAIFGGADATAEGSDAMKKIGGAAIGMATGGAKFIGNKALAIKSGLSAKMHEKKAKTEGISDEEKAHQTELAEKARGAQVARHDKAKEAGAGIRTKAANVFNDVTGLSEATGGNWKPKDEKQRLEASQKRSDRLNAAGASILGARETHTRRQGEREAIRNDEADLKRDKGYDTLAGKIATETGLKEKEAKKALSGGNFENTEIGKKWKSTAAPADFTAASDLSKGLGELDKKLKNVAGGKFTGLGGGLAEAGAEVGSSIPGVATILHAKADRDASKQAKADKAAIEANAQLIQTFNIEMKKDEIKAQTKDLEGAATKALAQPIADKLISNMKEQTNMQAKLIQDKLSKLDLAKDGKDVEKLKQELDKIREELANSMKKVTDTINAKP